MKQGAEKVYYAQLYTEQVQRIERGVKEVSDSIIMNIGLSIVVIILGFGLVFFTLKIVRHFRTSPSGVHELARRIAQREMATLERVKNSCPNLPKDEQYVIALKLGGPETEKGARKVVADSRKVANTLGEELRFKEVVSRAALFEYLRQQENAVRNASTVSEITNTVGSIIPEDL